MNPRRKTATTVMAATMILFFMCGLPFEGTSRRIGARHRYVVASQVAARFTVERVVAGVKAARANSKQLGRPKRVFRRDEVVRLREAGMSWRKIAARLKVPVTTVVEGCR
jgi:hypothetical protein